MWSKQGFFKATTGPKTTYRVAQILAKGPGSNNAGKQVIHSLCPRESWVFHTIHRFRTFFQTGKGKSWRVRWWVVERSSQLAR